METPVSKRGSPVTVNGKRGKRTGKKKAPGKDREARLANTAAIMNGTVKPPSRRKPMTKSSSSSYGSKSDVRLDMSRPRRRPDRTPVSLPASSSLLGERSIPKEEGIKGNTRGSRRQRRGCMGSWSAYDIVLWVLLVSATALSIWALSRTYGQTTVVARQPVDVGQMPPTDKQELPGALLHHYPFNIYDASSGHTMRYPSANGSGIPGLRWETLTWYKVCCKHESAFQCYPPQYATLRHDVKKDRVFLELVTVEDKNEPRIGQIGSRCTLYWSERQNPAL